MTTDSELYWCAGFLEGDGSFCGSPKHEGRRTKPHNGQTTYTVGPSLRVYAPQNSVEPLQKLKDRLGGAIYGPRTNKGRLSEKPYWFWRTTSKAEGIRVMEELYFLMSQRRQNQIDRAFSIIGHDPSWRRPQEKEDRND